MGTVLYWAEGTKEKDYRPGTGIEFTNSDRPGTDFILYLPARDPAAYTDGSAGILGSRNRPSGALVQKDLFQEKRVHEST
jgi:hypothetical protein